MMKIINQGIKMKIQKQLIQQRNNKIIIIMILMKIKMMRKVIYIQRLL